MISALTTVWLKCLQRTDEQSTIEKRIELYAKDLMAWPEETALVVLREHSKRSVYWPAWKELEDLRAEFEGAARAEALNTHDAPEGETFRDRLVRLGWPRSGKKIGMTLAQIGIHKYKEVLRNHADWSDLGLLDAMDRLARGKPAGIPDHGHEPFKTQREWVEFIESLEFLDSPLCRIPTASRERLRAIGASIDARQRPHAQAMGWVT